MSINKCECGCGGLCPNRFMHGHNTKGKKRDISIVNKMKEAWSRNRDSWKKSLKESANKPSFKEALSVAHKGKKLSEEHKNKISKGNSGKVRSDEVKSRISKSLKGILLGEKNPNFIHGMSNKNRIIRQSFEYKSWRKSVFERDNFTCKYCGAFGVYVTAHHIKSFAYYPELRFDLENGLTLCEPCHEKTDNYKGRNKNKLKQIQQ